MVIKLNDSCEQYKIKVSDMNRMIASYKSHFEESEVCSINHEPQLSNFYILARKEIIWRKFSTTSC
jgi:hypothetical protein